MSGMKKTCLFGSFMLGAAAGYYYRDYMGSKEKNGKKDDFEPEIVMPKCMAKKAKRMKKDLRTLWEDMI